MTGLMQRIKEKPVMIASGTFGWDGFGRGFELDTSPLGCHRDEDSDHGTAGGQPGTTLVSAAVGQSAPYLNSIGLPNPGLEEAIHSYLPMWGQYECPVVMSIMGNVLSDWPLDDSASRGVRPCQARRGL